MSINAADEDVPILDGHRDSNDDDSRRRRSRRRNRTGGLKWWVGRNAGEESERSIAVDDEAVSDDDSFILDDDSCCGRVVQALGRVQWFWAELVLFLYMFCDFPATLVNQKYTLEWISVYNWNDDLARNVTHDFNITDGGGSVSTCTSNTSSDEYKFSQRSQMMSSYFGMLRMAVWVFPAVLSTLVLGSVSDRHGRKWAFIPPILGCFLSMLGQMCIVHFRGSILWLLILDFATGISGSFGCVIMAGVAHVVGKTTARNRMLRITVLQLFLLAGSTVSPFTMGVAYNRLGATLTLAITAAVSGANLVYCLLCVPAMRGAVNSGLVVDSDPYSSSKSYSVDEPASPPSSLPPTYTPPPPPPPPPEPANGLSNSGGPTDQPPGLFRQISQHVRNTCNIYSSSSSGSGGKRGSGRGRAPAPNDHVGLTSSLLASFSELVASQSSTGFSLESCKSSGEAVCRLRILICAFFVIITAYFDVLIMTLFELNYPLCWGPATIGLYTGVFVSVAAVGSMVLAPFMERFSSHVSVAIVCCLTSAAYRVYLFFVRDTNSMFYGVVLNVFNMMLIPSVRTMMTLLVEPGRHGAVLGSISAVEILCCFLGSVIFSTVYSNTLLYSTATVFLVSASLYGIGAIIFTGYRIRYGTGSVILSGSMPDVLV